MDFLDILNMSETNKYKPKYSASTEAISLKLPHIETKYFHVSSDPYLDDKVLKPRIPAYLKQKKGIAMMKQHGLHENATIPRVCFAPTITGCVNAITNADKFRVIVNQLLYVYIPEKPLSSYRHKTNKDIVKDGDVYDAQATGEVWICEPVKVRLYGVISIDKIYKYTEKPIQSSITKDAYRDFYKFKWHWAIPPKTATHLNYDATQESSMYSDILLEAEADEDAPTDYGADAEEVDSTDDDPEESSGNNDGEEDAPTDYGAEDDEDASDEGTSEDNTDDATEEEDGATDYSEDSGEITPEDGDGPSDDDTSSTDDSDTTDGENATNDNSPKLLEDFINLYNSLSITNVKLDRCKSMDMLTSQTVAKVKEQIAKLSEYIYGYVNNTFKTKTYAENLYVYSHIVELYKISVRMLSKINEFKPIQ